MKLLVLDADSTLFNEEAIDLLAQATGTKEQVSKITESAMRGEIDFAASLRARVRLLKGLESSKLQQVGAELTLTRGAEELINKARAADFEVAVVSGGFVEILKPIMAQLEISLFRANSLEIVGNQLTGEVSGKIVDAHLKAEILLGFAEMLGVSSKETIAVGDGANDIEMINAAHIGIAFCAKPALRQVADYVIDERDLSLVSKFL